MCKELKDLENNFDSVHVKHVTEGDSPRTTVAVINGDVVHVGIAKCAPNDRFNKKLGRQMAAGRVERAFKVFSEESTKRTATFRREDLSYTFVSTDSQSTNDFLDEFYGRNKEE